MKEEPVHDERSPMKACRIVAQRVILTMHITHKHTSTDTGTRNMRRLQENGCAPTLFVTGKVCHCRTKAQ